MGTIVKTYTLANGDTSDADKINTNFDTVYNEFNGGIDNDNIASDAAIAISKVVTTTISTLTGSETLTNKTLTSPILNTVKKVTQTVTAYSPAGAGTATMDLSLGNVFLINMPAGNVTLAISNETVGQFFMVKVKQDGVGSRTVTWMDTITWAGGSAPTLTTTASKIDIFGFEVTAADTYLGTVVGQNY